MTLPHRQRYHAPQGEEGGRSETLVGVKVAVAGVREKEKDKGLRFNLLAMGTFVAVRDVLNNTGRQHLFLWPGLGKGTLLRERVRDMFIVRTGITYMLSFFAPLASLLASLSSCAVIEPTIMQR